MKDRHITYISLVIAIAALGHSLWLRSQSEKIAEEALRRRETELVIKATPRMVSMIKGQRGLRFDAKDFQPKTIEELLRPLNDLISMMSGEAPSQQPVTPSNESK